MASAANDAQILPKIPALETLTPNVTAPCVPKPSSSPLITSGLLLRLGMGQFDWVQPVRQAWVDFPPFPEQKKRAELKAIALSRTGRRLASGGGHGVEIWGRREDGSLGLEGQLGGDISGLDFDSHESRLVTASSDGVIRVWGMGSGGPEIEIVRSSHESGARALVARRNFQP